MGIYIQDLEMPKAGTWLTIRIYPDGKCVFPIWQGDCNINKDAKAIAVPNHVYPFAMGSITKGEINNDQS